MFDPEKELDEAIVRQVIPNLTRIYQRVFVLSQLTEEQRRLITHSLDMSLAGFDLSNMVNYINLAHTRDGIQVLDLFDPGTFEEVCRTADVAQKQTASSIHNVFLPFYHRLAANLKWCADYIVALQARHTDLISDFSNHLNRKPRRRLEPGDVFRSSGGYYLLVVEIVNAEKESVGIYGHLHANPDNPIRSEIFPGDGEVSLVGYIPVDVHWVEWNGNQAGKRTFATRDACRDACNSNPSIPGDVWPMPRGKEMEL